MPNTTPENLILLCGELITDGTFFNTVSGKDFFEYTMKITLPSGTDLLPVLICNEQIDDTVKKGAVLSVTGKIISFDCPLGENAEPILKVLVEEVYAGETEITSGVFLTGNVIRKPYAFFLDEIERAEFQLAVGSETDPVYIPVVALGEPASVAKKLQLGDCVSVLGQFHSFEYLDLNNQEATQKTAYEVEILTFTALPKI